jgi:G6PDH family F420-dependent oxidoreductase
MVAIDYMAHQEQYSPSRLLEFAELAENAGFEWVWTSDHFHPWFHTNAEAGFAWAWLAAAGERLDIPVGTCVTPAGEHYHPGLMAQAFATLQELNDDRVILGLSTGEAMNEKPLGHEWPEYPVRRDRLEETCEILHELWAADGFVDYDGEHYQLDEAHLYTKPDRRPEVHLAANGPSTASLTGEYGDGFITVKKGEEYTDRLYPAVRKYTREAGRDPDEIETTLLVIASYADDYEDALAATEPWWATTQDVFDRALANPKQIEAVGKQATREQVESKFLVADSAESIAAELESYADMGFDRVAVANTSPDPEQFFEVMGDSVIPTL